MSAAKIQAQLNEAIAAHRAGKWEIAARLYRQVCTLAPNRFDALHLSGLLAYQQGRVAEAIEMLTRALRLDPKAVVCEMRLGLALQAAGRAADAERHLRHVIAVKADYAEAWEALGYALKLQDRLREALACCERATSLRPAHAAGWYNLGLTLSALGRHHDALAAHERAVAADSGYALAHYGRAQTLQQLQRIPEALADYARFLAAEPAHHEARSYRLLALHYTGACSRAELFAEHRAYGEAVGGSARPTPPARPDPERRLRVAFFSPDLREHSCAYFIEPILQHLDRDAFEIVLYHDHFREDAVSARLKRSAALWRNFIGQPAGAVEAAIRRDAPDLIVDLAGHTGLNRLPLFARRLAPVQISYLGYPDTTGVPAMDYRFVDAITDPEGEADAFATERLVRFAPTAWAYAPPVDAPSPRRAGERASGPATFGCFNNLAKVTDAALELWSRILAEIPDSRLLLKGHGLHEPAAQARYRERLARAGLPVDRVELLDRTPDTRSHLALYRRVDVALDTFPYHGTTTTCEALWMGVPVVTLAGSQHMSRVGVSLLTAAGLPAAIASTPAEYVQRAIEFARTGAAPAREPLRASALMDHAGQAARFGAALRGCWRESCQRHSIRAA